MRSGRRLRTIKVDEWGEGAVKSRGGTDTCLFF